MHQLEVYPACISSIQKASDFESQGMTNIGSEAHRRNRNEKHLNILSVTS